MYITGPDGVYEPEFSQYESEFSLYTSTIQTHPGLRGSQTKRKILAILDAIEFTQVGDEYSIEVNGAIVLQIFTLA